METICLRFLGKKYYVLCIHTYSHPGRAVGPKCQLRKYGHWSLHYRRPQAVWGRLCAVRDTLAATLAGGRVRLVITCIEPAADIDIKTARLFFNFKNMLIHLPGLRCALTAALGLLCACARCALRAHIAIRGFLTAVTSLRAEHGR